MPIKFLLLGGGGSWVFWKGGVEVPILFFMGVGIFPTGGIWKVHGFPFSGGKAPQNSPFAKSERVC